MATFFLIQKKNDSWKSFCQVDFIALRFFREVSLNSFFLCWPPFDQTWPEEFLNLKFNVNQISVKFFEKLSMTRHDSLLEAPLGGESGEPRWAPTVHQSSSVGARLKCMKQVFIYLLNDCNERFFIFFFYFLPQTNPSIYFEAKNQTCTNFKSKWSWTYVSWIF